MPRPGKKSPTIGSETPKALPPAEPLPVTAKEVRVNPAMHFDKRSIAKLRAELALSQSVFAQALNVSAETIRGWEQGKRAPDGASLRLLELTKNHPDWLEESIRVRKPLAKNETE